MSQKSGLQQEIFQSLNYDHERWTSDLARFTNAHAYSCPPKYFYAKTEDAHKELRKAILSGQDTIEEFISIDRRDIVPSIDTIRNELADLEKLVPDAYNQYIRINSNKVFLLEKMQTLSNGHVRLVKPSKNFLDFMDHNYPGQFDKNKVTGALSKIYKKLGEFKTEEQKIKVVMTCSPYAMIRIGHYYPDRLKGSCFQRGGGNEKHKYWISFTPNTFVLLFMSPNTKDPFSVEDEDCYGRLWGIFEKDFRTVHLYNIYKNNSTLTDGNSLEAIRRFMGIKFPDLKEMPDAEKPITQSVFINKTFYRRFSYHSTNSVNIDLTNVFVSTIESRKCCKCGILCDIGDKFHKTTTGYLYCERCTNMYFAKCIISGDYESTANMYKIVINGKTFCVKPQSLGKHSSVYPSNADYSINKDHPMYEEILKAINEQK